ncbi:hypothetical protein DLAC_07761 [Tieghemostelium lacteum]|uniref:Uncharacterized protein n=1 Tax=Tieghemostelium lacteum TaxID=361077 RepID=A0A151ZAC4_TIELA|nr:hypothetical protein DLAC_07761 [Tieghemostelium lacteum]|eukprot:KYQ90890.1 hypothetical protein DLAC_07761 [Tieghemostelium lacteum]
MFGGLNNKRPLGTFNTNQQQLKNKILKKDTQDNVHSIGGYKANRTMTTTNRISPTSTISSITSLPSISYNNSYVNTSNQTTNNLINNNNNSSNNNSPTTSSSDIDFDDYDFGSSQYSFAGISQPLELSFDMKELEDSTHASQVILEEIENNMAKRESTQTTLIKHNLQNQNFSAIPGRQPLKVNYNINNNSNQNKNNNNNYNNNNSYKGGQKNQYKNNNNNNATVKDIVRVHKEVPDLKTISNSITEILSKVYELPATVAEIYISRGISSLYDWQKELLCSDYAINGKNYVYSQPTSGGKTLVSEICLIKNIVSYKKKGMFIFPFISIVNEKARSLKEFGEKLSFPVDSYYGGEGTIPASPGHRMMVCTIEKANIVINQMIEDNKIHELGCVVIDELHMVGDNDRGILLELLISKLIYCGNGKIQIIGMSATIPNIGNLSQWFRGHHYQGDYRPVPLTEYVKVGNKVFDNKNNEVKTLEGTDENRHLVELCAEVVPDHSVLVFCASKQLCMDTALMLSKSLPTHVIQSNQEERENMIIMIEGSIGAKLEENSKKMIRAGVYFHNSNLTNEEREIIENHYKKHVLLILCSTSTLSAGVNLPARRVIMRSPKMGPNLLSPRNYKQMCGRAGRAGIDKFGESFLISDRNTEKHARFLMTSKIDILYSNLDTPNNWTRIILESLCTKVSNSLLTIFHFITFTLYVTHPRLPPAKKHMELYDYFKEQISISLKLLVDKKLIEVFKDPKLTIQQQEELEKDPENLIYKPTKIGLASFKSTISIEENDKIFKELSDFQTKPFYFNEPLNLCFLCTPMVNIPQVIDWENFRCLLTGLKDTKAKVAEIFGINSEYIEDVIIHGPDLKSPRLLKYIRFYFSLALCDMIQESQLSPTASKYRIDRGSLQGLMQNASGYAFTISLFCQTIGWSELNALVKLYIKRLDKGAKEELIALMEIPNIKRGRARQLYNAGFKTVKSVASATESEISVNLKIDNKDAKRIINAASKLLEKKSEELRLRASEYILDNKSQIDIESKD